MDASVKPDIWLDWLRIGKLSKKPFPVFLSYWGLNPPRQLEVGKV